MEDSSSSSSSDEEMQERNDSTPRKGEDKKRQRFATETEVIEIQQDDDSSASMPVIRPLRLTDRMEPDSESDASPKMATIADILGDGPEGTTTFPQPLVISKDCRYSFQVKVPACDNPSQHIADKFKGFFKWAQDKIGKDLAIATWNDAADKQKVYSKTQPLPKPSETSAWTAIWGTWVNLKPQQAGQAFLKIRFVTKSPDTLTTHLKDIGELRDEITAETGISIGRLPIACQAVQIGCVGWLFGSNKYMNSNDLLQEVMRLANIPSHIRMGISWRAIKLENGRTPPWVDNHQEPASALHVDMDWFHAPVYKPMLANLFKNTCHNKTIGSQPTPNSMFLNQWKNLHTRSTHGSSGNERETGIPHQGAHHSDKNSLYFEP